MTSPLTGSGWLGGCYRIATLYRQSGSPFHFAKINQRRQMFCFFCVLIMSFQYYDLLLGVAKTRYDRKLSLIGLKECPCRLPQGSWKDDPTIWPEMEYGDMYSYLIDTPGLNYNHYFTHSTLWIVIFAYIIVFLTPKRCVIRFAVQVAVLLCLWFRSDLTCVVFSLKLLILQEKIWKLFIFIILKSWCFEYDL